MRGAGFLSESGDFARACAAAGLAFVGPPAPLLDLFGSKTASRTLAEKHGVPVLSGSAAAVTTADEVPLWPRAPSSASSPQPSVRRRQAAAVVKRIGLPVVLKAVFGGGGKGMRVVHKVRISSTARAQRGRGFGRRVAAGFARRTSWRTRLRAACPRRARRSAAATC